MYKCAIVGVGPNRSREHADAYKHIKSGKLACASARSADRLQAFGEQFGINSLYKDYREMFAREKPDLVHLNTPPNIRLEVLEAAESAGVSAVIMEKPLAIQGEDYLAIKEFCQGSKVKVAINHQLHFHPRRFELQKIVEDGNLVEMRFITAGCGMNLAFQGTHTLQAIGAFHPKGKPQRVFGQISGAGSETHRVDVCGTFPTMVVGNLEDTPQKHFAPGCAQAIIDFDDGVQALLQSGEISPKVGREAINTHKYVTVYGSKGHVRWTMWSWEVLVDGKSQGGTHEYWDEDILGQARMTEAMLDWIGDDRAVHPLCFDRAHLDFNIILAIYMSGLQHRMVDLPVEPELNLINKMRAALS